MAMDVSWGGAGMDLLTPEGFLGSIFHTCRLSAGSGALAAPVCSSFVFMFLDINDSKLCCANEFVQP